MNLLENKPKYHSELFNKDNSPKTEYTFENLCTYIRTIMAPTLGIRSNFTTREDLEKRRKAAIDSTRELTMRERNELIRIVKKYDLEEILFSIDCSGFDEDNFDVDTIERNIAEGAVEIARRNRISKYGMNL